MKVLKKLLFFLLIITTLLIIGYFILSSMLSPKYSGELKFEGLQDKVTVFYDDQGVPHINAENDIDAYKVFGYVHAQDRLWQMELIRRLAAGRLAEVFGKDLVRVDKFFSGLGIEEAAEKTITKLDKNSNAYKLTEAYLAGINQFIKEGQTPLEFYMVGLEKEPYTIKDVYNVFGYMAFSFAAAHRTDPILTEVKEKYGNAHLEELIGAFSENLTVNKTKKNPEIKARMSAALHTIYEKLPVSPFIGSNSWVLGPEKTKNGKVILANDPHIAFSQPSVWYQAHIKTPTYEMYGFNLALTPFPLLGHNREYACGLTMLANDDIDFYIEENNPENPLEYKTENGFTKYELINKTIKVKDGEDTTYQIKVSRHGPIMNDIIDQIKDKRPIAMQWIYTKLPNKLLDVSYHLSHANSLETFKKGAAKVHAPGLNIMYGDVKGNIAWFSSAKLYQVRDSLFRQTYLDGASGKDEIIDFVDFEENPQAINPDWNYVYSANHQIDSVRGKLYPGYYQPQDRAKRIVNILDSKEKFSKEEMKAMIFDITSSTATTIIKNMLSGLNTENLSSSEKKAYEEITNWNGSYTKNSVAATIYNRLLFEFYKATYEDEMSDEGFSMFLNTQAAKKAIAEQVKRQKSVWWDNVTTKTVETRNDIVESAFKNSVTFLRNQLGENIENWKWKRVATVEHEHPIGKAGGVLRKIFNVGPFETVGGNEVLNNQIFSIDSTGYYKVKAGPSTRRIIDFSDIENSVAVIPTGQSGNIFSPHYKDQAEKYLNGEFFTMKLNIEEIKKSKNKLEFIP